MHIFVTGGSGQTGPAIVSELIAHGHTVTGLARSEKSVESAIRAWSANSSWFSRRPGSAGEQRESG